MTRNEIMEQVQEIFCDVLDNEDIVLVDTTTSDDIEEWDSLTHIQLVVGIEKCFKLKFTSIEISSWKNVGEMCEAIVQSYSN